MIDIVIKDSAPQEKRSSKTTPLIVEEAHRKYENNVLFKIQKIIRDAFNSLVNLICFTLNLYIEIYNV